MELAMAIAIGVLFAAGVYLILRPNLIRIVMGFGLMSNAVNLMMITSGGYATNYEAPFVPKTQVANVATDGTDATNAAHRATDTAHDVTTDAAHDAHTTMASVVESVTPATETTHAMMDPLPPDIILTAIVISFAVGALFLIVCYRAYLDFGTDNPEKMPQFVDPDAAAAEVDPEFIVYEIPDVIDEISKPHPNAPHEPDVSQPLHQPASLHRPTTG